ncbi:MAG: hemerythrin domain-containing protein [Deltaproteobacteria bacterium]|nr:hemerythrin domain-containing protein [Deltaproteobacteria bacterium]
MIEPNDPIYRNVENDLKEGEIMSPMDPPKIYDMPKQEEYSFDDYAEPIKVLLKEHEDYLEVLNDFETHLMFFRGNEYEFTPEISNSFKKFFKFMDEHTVPHNEKEEKALFPLLRSRLIEVGECSPGMNKTTPTDVMEGEHLQVAQASYLVFNLLGLGSKLPDQNSRKIVFQNAVEQAREIVETMKVHIYKENNVLFPLAQKHLRDDEWTAIGEKMGLDSNFTV